MAHRPCLLSVHVPSATAGMTSRYDHLRPILGCSQQAGQSHLNSDAQIAHEGCPQGGRAPTRGAPTDCILAASTLGRAPTRGAPTDCLLAASTLGRAPTRGAPTDCPLSAFCPGKGTHKGCPYRLSSLGVLPWEGHPQGVPLPIVLSRRFALGRAPTRGAPTDCLLSAFCPEKGAHKGRPYPIQAASRGFSNLMQLP